MWDTGSAEWSVRTGGCVVTNEELIEEILDGAVLTLQNRCYSSPAGAASLIFSVLRELASALKLTVGKPSNEG